HPGGPDRGHRHAVRAASPDPYLDQRRAGEPAVWPVRPTGRPRSRRRGHTGAVRCRQRRSRHRAAPPHHVPPALARQPSPDLRGPAPAPLGGGLMTGYEGTGALVRLALRPDRVRLPVWVVVIAIMPAGTAAQYKSLYPTRESIQAVSGVISNPSLV